MASSNAEVDIPEFLGDFKIRHSNDKCHTCEQKDEGGKLLKCSKCHWALYCDASCQKAHWDIHKPECKVLRTNPKVCCKPSPTFGYMVDSNEYEARDRL